MSDLLTADEIHVLLRVRDECVYKQDLGAVGGFYVHPANEQSPQFLSLGVNDTLAMLLGQGFIQLDAAAGIRTTRHTQYDRVRLTGRAEEFLANLGI